MALNEQMLREQTDLGLTDAQITAIAALSQKDEDIVFPKKYGEMLGNIDTMIAAKSSIIRNEGEKTTEYMGRVLGQLKSAADEGATFKTTNESLTAEIAKLKDDIAKGTGNEQLKADLEKLRGDLASAKRVNGELQESLTKKEAEYKGKLEGFKMDSEIAAAMSGVTLKKELPESAKQALIDTAMQRVKGMRHVYDETAGAFIFQNEDGTPMKDTKLNNLTVADMLTAELEKMQVLDTGRRQGGAGGNGNLPGGNGSGGGASVDIGMARTQSEATDIIEKQLMSQGHAKTDPDWGALFNKAYDDNISVIEKLPLR
jgi:hypothetical protein